jgi:hypothetical protein
MAFFRRSTVDATVADQALVVRVGGDMPRLWRGSLKDVSSATLEVQPVTEKGVQLHRLVLVQAGGATEEIARFTRVQDARRAFAVVSRRLMRGIAAEETARRPFLLRLLIGIGKAVVWILFIFILLFTASSLYLKSRGLDSQVGAPSAPAASASAPGPAAPTGVPVPADQLFGE